MVDQRWRFGGVGASDIAATVSGKYGGAFRVVAERIGVDVPGRDVIDEVDAVRGHTWEPFLADGVHVHSGGRLWVVGEQTEMEHPENRRFRCTLDGFVADRDECSVDDVDGVVEFKSRLVWGPWAWEYWLPQVQWQLFVSGLPRGLLVVGTIDVDYDLETGDSREFVSGVKYVWVDADGGVQEQLVGVGEWLLDHVDRGVLPPADGEGALPYVKQVYGVKPVAGSKVDLSSVRWEVERLVELRDLRRKVENELDAVEAVVRDRIGVAHEGWAGEWRVRCGNPRRAFTKQSERDLMDMEPEIAERFKVVGVDKERLRRELPDTFDAYRFVHPHRALTVKKMEVENE